MIEGQSIDIAFVEDDEALGRATTQALRLSGANVELFRDALTALNSINAEFPGVVVSDVRLPGMDGLALFDNLRKIDEEIPVIFTTGHGDVTMAVEAMKNGAADFFTKPYSIADLMRSVELAAQKRSLVLENRRLHDALKERAKDQIIGTSAAAEQLRNVMTAVAGSEIDVVLEGELGTGKTHIARLIHDLSARRDRPFITIDAGVLAHEDAELLLFGREPSAGLSRTGMIERANGGTLFLDQVEAASGGLLTRLMSALDTRSILPAGADRSRKLNIRIIAASLIDQTAQPLSASMHPLIHRLGAVRIVLPPLSARREDIADFFRHFVARHERDLGIRPRKIGDHEWRRIQIHNWPGNLRELSNFAKAFVLGLEGFGTTEVQSGRSLQGIVAGFERALLEDALREANGQVAQVQATLRTPRKTLYDKFAKYDIKPRDYR